VSYLCKLVIANRRIVDVPSASTVTGICTRVEQTQINISVNGVWTNQGDRHCVVREVEIQDVQSTRSQTTDRTERIVGCSCEREEYKSINWRVSMASIHSPYISMERKCW
jgi:hypothetical protein